MKHTIKNSNYYWYNENNTLFIYKYLIKREYAVLLNIFITPGPIFIILLSIIHKDMSLFRNLHPLQYVIYGYIFIVLPLYFIAALFYHPRIATFHNNKLIINRITWKRVVPFDEIEISYIDKTLSASSFSRFRTVPFSIPSLNLFVKLKTNRNIKLLSLFGKSHSDNLYELSNHINELINHENNL